MTPEMEEDLALEQAMRREGWSDAEIRVERLVDAACEQKAHDSTVSVIGVARMRDLGNWMIIEPRTRYLVFEAIEAAFDRDTRAVSTGRVSIDNATWDATIRLVR